MDSINCNISENADNNIKSVFGSSKATKKLLKDIDKVVLTDLSVLITGETGTGKEVISRMIHTKSRRSHQPFVPVISCALPSQLIQSELFGHEKGSFTGAHQKKIGYIEMANRGSLFLDEIGDLPLDLQASLLRFLEEKKVVRVGGTSEIPIDIRVIAATNVDLSEAINNGQFREDLYHRLNVLQIKAPALRERSEDIECLAWHFFEETKKQNSKNKATGFSEDALSAMKVYAWPGNIRELRNRVQRSVVMSEHHLISPEDLGLDRRATLSHIQTLQEARDETEKIHIYFALRQTNNKVVEASRLLGVTRATLYRLIDKHKASVSKHC